MTTAIKFGTSGWRAIVADEFTVANIRLAVARHCGIRENAAGPAPRCWWAAIRASSARALWPRRRECWPRAGVTPIVIPEAAPTPAIAYAVRTLKTSGAINFTASHNPPEYNGIKYSTPDGAPALPEVTRQIEAAIGETRELHGGGIPKPPPPREDLRPPT